MVLWHGSTMATPIEVTPEERRLRDAAAAGEAAWRRVGLRLRSVTPAGLARFLLVTAALVIVAQALAWAWASLLPFSVGLVLAYLVLPIVDLLDRVLPRWLAALVVTVGEIVLLVAFFALLIPPLVAEVPELVRALPGADQVRVLIADARAALSTLPPDVQASISGGLQQSAATVQANLIAIVGVALTAIAAAVLGVLGTFGFVLGFIAVPTWLLGVLTDRRAGVRAVDQILPGWLRPDFWAVLRIADRRFGSYLRGQIVRALVFGIALYAAFAALDRYDLTSMRFPLSLAAFATVAYLIPDIGPILGALPAVLAALARSPQEAFVVLATYVGVSFLEQQLVAPRIEERSIDIHPVVLVPLLIAISQFGLIWVVVAAPMIVVARDLFRYVYGRLGNPPRSAGVLPDEPWPLPVSVVAAVRRRRLRPPPTERAS
jgi:predicted PurR-regulated permease PerM